MSQRISSFPIQQFFGVDAVDSATDQPPGTLAVATGINIVPTGAISFGPKWLTAWGQTALNTAIATALSGATANKVHFVTLTRSGYTFLIAWEFTAGRPRGIVHVVGTGDPSFASSSGSAVTAPNTTIYRGKTNSLPWYGSWVDNQLFLGNGTDINLVWASAALGFLGPQSTPTDPQDISQVAFPPCKSWVKATNGIRYGAGNVTYPLRIWASELPNLNYAQPQGLKTSAYSYRDLQVNATAITALSIVGESLIAHLDIGPPVILLRTDNSQGGWKFDVRPMEANASAIDPNCARDEKIGSFYFGRDLEVYAPEQRISWNKAGGRDQDVVTKRSAGYWNAMMTKPLSGTDYFTIWDAKNSRFWIWAVLDVSGRQGIYCYDGRAEAVTGPFFFPDFQAVCQLRDDNLNGCMVAGITRSGAFLWADLAPLGIFTLPAYGTALPAAYAPVLTPPTPSAGRGYVALNSVTGAVQFVMNSNTITLATPWAAWTSGGSISPDMYFNDARIAVIELAETDLGSPSFQKELSCVRALWSRNSVFYVGCFSECNGYTGGAWRGSGYPYPSALYGISGEGETARIRLVVISFNAADALLQTLGIDHLQSVKN